MDDLDAGVKDREFYLKAAYDNAFGTFDEGAWDPARGFNANRARIVKLYDYYQDTYLKRPSLFLWAGLGRMAGGAVVGGLDFLMNTSSESSLTQTMVKSENLSSTISRGCTKLSLTIPASRSRLPSSMIQNLRRGAAMRTRCETLRPLMTAACRRGTRRFWKTSSSQSYNRNTMQ